MLSDTSRRVYSHYYCRRNSLLFRLVASCLRSTSKKSSWQQAKTTLGCLSTGTSCRTRGTGRPSPSSATSEFLPKPLHKAEIFRPTWIEANIYLHLSEHPRLASSLLLLKSPSWDTTLAIYPVSTLSANNDLLVDTSSNPPVIQANVRRVIPELETEVYIVCVLAKGRASERVIVQRVVEEARKLVHGRPEAETGSQFWDALGICTWESFRAGRECQVRLRGLMCSWWTEATQQTDVA